MKISVVFVLCFLSVAFIATAEENNIPKECVEGSGARAFSITATSLTTHIINVNGIDIAWMQITERTVAFWVQPFTHPFSDGSKFFFKGNPEFAVFPVKDFDKADLTKLDYSNKIRPLFREFTEEQKKDLSADVWEMFLELQQLRRSRVEMRLNTFGFAVREKNENGEYRYAAVAPRMYMYTDPGYPPYEKLKNFDQTWWRGEYRRSGPYIIIGLTMKYRSKPKAFEEKFKTEPVID